MAYQKKARPASPEEIKRFGHVSVFFERMFKKYPQLTVGDFNEKVLGKARSDTKLYGWMNARTGCGRDSAVLLGKVLGIPAGFFGARSLDDQSDMTIPEPLLPDRILAKLTPGKVKAIALLPAPEIPLTAPGFTSELICKTNGDGSMYIHYIGTVTRERAVEIMAVLVK